MAKISYCSWEGEPAILKTEDDGRVFAWIFSVEGAWAKADVAEMALNATELDKPRFERMFGKLELPKDAS